jgi:cobalt/nickel transport system permease protein
LSNGEGFLVRNLAGFTGALESVVLNEELGRRRGLLQLLDPRIKLVTIILFIVMAGLARSIWMLGIIFAVIIILSLLSKIPIGFFLKRVLLFIPIFTLVIALPALFITPGTPLFDLAGVIVITEQGLRTAVFLFLRVTDSLSLGVLLILTTPWNNLLVALRWFRVPVVVVDIVGMTYRYIFLLLHNANSMFLARRSRMIRTFSGTENRGWLSGALGTTLARTQHLSEEVYLAMISRGYSGEVRLIGDLQFKSRDYLWLALSLGAAVLLFWGNH